MYLIAECGINHSGNMDMVDMMIRKAAECGADAVKFQKRDIDTVYSKEFLDGYRESPWGNTQRAQKEGLELSYSDFLEIDNICKEIGIDWFASSWDLKSLEMMESFDPPFHKIASPMLTNREFVEAVALTGRKVLISSGMTEWAQVYRLLHLFNDYVIMHCVSLYPCPDELCNIKRVQKLKNMFPERQVGYSGHERGIVPTLAAIAYGAEYIERHFTLDRTDYGSDQAASLEPKGLALIREYGDQLERCMGDGEFKILPEELENAKKMRYWE